MVNGNTIESTYNTLFAVGLKEGSLCTSWSLVAVTTAQFSPHMIFSALLKRCTLNANICAFSSLGKMIKVITCIFVIIVLKKVNEIPKGSRFYDLLIVTKEARLIPPYTKWDSRRCLVNNVQKFVCTVHTCVKGETRRRSWIQCLLSLRWTVLRSKLVICAASHESCVGVFYTSLISRHYLIYYIISPQTQWHMVVMWLV